MSKLTFDQLLDAGAHFGHQKRKWNPAMAPYIFMEKNGIHIIDLHKTVAKLDEASAVIKSIAKSGSQNPTKNYSTKSRKTTNNNI